MPACARGGASRRQRPVYQPGNEVRATWRGRLAEHLGTLTAELQAGRAGQWIDDPLRLGGISAACAVAEASLPERAPAPAVYRGLLALLDALEREDWGEAYVAWEIALLGELGFGLDLERCAATGRNDRLAFVSPNSGRAVSLSAGEPYADRLLRLPDFLNGGADAGAGSGSGPGSRIGRCFLAGYRRRAQDRWPFSRTACFRVPRPPPAAGAPALRRSGRKSRRGIAVSTRGAAQHPPRVAFVELIV